MNSLETKESLINRAKQLPDMAKTITPLFTLGVKELEELSEQNRERQTLDVKTRDLARDIVWEALELVLPDEVARYEKYKTAKTVIIKDIPVGDTTFGSYLFPHNAIGLSNECGKEELSGEKAISYGTVKAIESLSSRKVIKQMKEALAL